MLKELKLLISVYSLSTTYQKEKKEKVTMIYKTQLFPLSILHVLIEVSTFFINYTYLHLECLLKNSCLEGQL